MKKTLCDILKVALSLILGGIFNDRSFFGGVLFIDLLGICPECRLHFPSAW